MKKIIFLILLFFGLLVSVSAENKIEVSLAGCVDGDTVKFYIQGKQQTVRLLAIDTPETKHPKKEEEPYGKEASNYTCNSLKKATKIELEYDKNAKKDKYDRVLAWIFIDDVLLQESLIKKGYAKVAYLYDEYTYTDLLEKEEKQAKLNKVGMWSDGKAKKEVESETFLTLFAIIVGSLLFLFDKKFRKKQIRKAKRKYKKRNW